MSEDSRELLQEFTNNFLEFRNTVIDIRNNFENFELSDGVQQGDLEDRTEKGIAELEGKIAEFEAKLAEPGISEDDRIKYQAMLDDHKQRITEAKKYVKESGKSVESQEVAYRDQLREAINKMNDSLVSTGMRSEKHNVIDLLKENIQAHLRTLEVKMGKNYEKLKKATDIDEKKAYHAMIEKYKAEYQELTDLMANLDKFNEMMEGITNKYIKNHRSIDVVDLTNRFAVLDELADYFDKNMMDDTLTVDFRILSDGSMALDISCGHRRVYPNPIIKPTDNVELEIRRNLNAFAFKYSEETGKSIGAITSEMVRVKVNGEDKTKIGYDEVPAYGKNVMLTKGVGLDEPEPEKGKGEGEPEPEPEKGKGDGAPEPEPEPEAEKGKGEGDPEPEPEAEKGKGEGEPEPEPEPEKGKGEGEPEPEPEKGPEVAESGRKLDATDLHAMKVQSRRAATKEMFKKAESILGIAAVGLGFAGATLGFGLAPAAVLGGAFAATLGIEVGNKIIENIKFNATKRKFRKIARRVEEELGILIEPVFDTKRRDCGFVLVDEDGNRLSDGYLTSEMLSAELPEGLDDKIVTIFNEEFARANKYRGKGESANTMKEIRYRNFPPITFDNPKAAFNEFGGVKTANELNGFRFDVDGFARDIELNRGEDGPKPEDEVVEADPKELGEGEPEPEPEAEKGKGEGEPEPEPEAEKGKGEGEPEPEPEAEKGKGEGEPEPEPEAEKGKGEGEPEPEPEAEKGKGEGEPEPEPEAEKGKGEGEPEPEPEAEKGKGEGEPDWSKLIDEMLSGLGGDKKETPETYTPKFPGMWPPAAPAPMEKDEAIAMEAKWMIEHPYLQEPEGVEAPVFDNPADAVVHAIDRVAESMGADAKVDDYYTQLVNMIQKGFTPDQINGYISEISDVRGIVTTEADKERFNQLVTAMGSIVSYYEEGKGKGLA